MRAHCELGLSFQALIWNAVDPWFHALADRNGELLLFFFPNTCMLSYMKNRVTAPLRNDLPPPRDYLDQGMWTLRGYQETPIQKFSDFQKACY